MLSPSRIHTNHSSPYLATGKTLEEIDALFARSPEVRERLEKQNADRRDRGGSRSGPMGRRVSEPTGRRVSAMSNGSAKMDVSYREKL